MDRPIGAIIIVILFALFGGLIVFTSSYFLTLSLLEQDPILSNMSNTTLILMSIPSLITGILYLIGADQVWGKKNNAWNFALFTALFSLISSIIVQIFVTTGMIMIGVSWIITIISLIILALLFSSDVRDYLSIVTVNPLEEYK